MRKALSILALVMLPAATGAEQVQAPTNYPNELPGLRFYEIHLKPLRLYASDRDTVARVLGSTEGGQIQDWRIQPFFIGEDKSSTVAPELVGRLADIEITPKHSVSMLGVKFPKAFTQGRGFISEINVSCHVYSDGFGLEYWIYSENSKFAKKGDLSHIVYGPKPRPTSLRRLVVF